MNTESLEVLQVRAGDGLASPEERATLVAAGLNPDAWPPVRAVLREALMSGPVPQLAETVLDRVAPGDAGVRANSEVSSLLRSEVQAHGSPQLVDGVMSAIGASAPVGGTLRTALLHEAGPAPELWGPVAAAIGVETDSDLGALLREAIRDEAGEPGLALSSVGMAGTARSSPWALPTLALVAAATLLFVFVGNPPADRYDEIAYDIAPINEVHIEDITSDTSAIVHVMQFDVNAPTIIFIDEGPEEPDVEEGSTTL